MKPETYVILIMVAVLGLLIVDLGQAYQAFDAVGGMNALIK